jgi:hypothetical protein
MSQRNTSSLDSRQTTKTTPLDSITDLSSDVSSTCHTPATQKDISRTSYKLCTSTKQKAQQRNLDDVSSLKYSSFETNTQAIKTILDYYLPNNKCA